MDNVQLSEAKKYIQEALNALQTLSGPPVRPEIKSTEALQKAEQAISLLKSSLTETEKPTVEQSEHAILKAKQTLLTSELSNGKKK